MHKIAQFYKGLHKAHIIIGKNTNMFSKFARSRVPPCFRSKLKFGKNVHDKAFINAMELWYLFNLNNTEITSTKEVPYNSNANTKWHEDMQNQLSNEWNDNFQNILVNHSKTNGDNDLERRMDIMFRRRIQQLCNGKVRLFFLHISIL